MSTNIDPQSNRLAVIREQLDQARAASKCHPCGCFRGTVETLSTSPLAEPLRPVLARAREAFAPKRYDCLGCAVCFPALAANALAEACPDHGAAVDVCPTDVPAVRSGWPPLPGDYQVVRYRAPVAVCTLNSDVLVSRLTREPLEALALVGTMRTENLGIERLIRNTLANPHIRFLILCGQDTQQAVGHLPGQSLVSLFVNGIDERGRIRGAQGKRPVLKNVSAEEVGAFVSQVEVVDRVGVEDERALAECIGSCGRRAPGPLESATRSAGRAAIEAIEATQPRKLVADPAGFFVVYPEPRRTLLIVEHYRNDGVLDCILEGRTAVALYSTALERQLLSRLDHAAYLGRELARAEHSLKTGEAYVQDRAPGELPGDEKTIDGCGCSTAHACGGMK